MPGEENVHSMKPLGYIFSIGRVLCAKHASSTHDPYVRSGQATPIYHDSITHEDLVCDVANCGTILARNCTDGCATRGNTPVTGKSQQKSQRKDKTLADQTQQQSPTPEEIAAILAQKQQQHQARIQKAYNFVTGADPLVLLGLGTLVLLMWAIASVTQIQTSEMLAMHAGRMPVQVEWGVVLQPYQLVTGTVPVQYMGPYCYGWIIQTITLIWAYALEHAVQKLHETNKHLGKWYGIISLLLISLNSWADYNNLPGSDPLVQALMAVAIGLMAVAGLPVGLVVLKAGLAKMGASK